MELYRIKTLGGKQMGGKLKQNIGIYKNMKRIINKKYADFSSRGTLVNISPSRLKPRGGGSASVQLQAQTSGAVIRNMRPETR